MSVAKTANISPLDPAATDPLYRQIYDRFRDAIACGVLKPGGRIPSARALTNELGLARGTIEAAYSLLAAEGYIQPRGQAGTVVTPGLKLRMPVASMIPRANSDIVAPIFHPDSILPFQMGLPALDAFPRKIWARLGAQCVRASHATWPSPRHMACLHCAPRSPRISAYRAGSAARHVRYS
jgi:GntR family transcriptional regulator / MocR family aminotransferase